MNNCVQVTNMYEMALNRLNFAGTVGFLPFED